MMVDWPNYSSSSETWARFEKLEKEIKRLCRLFNKNRSGYRVLHLTAAGKMSAEDGAAAIRLLIAGKRVKLPAL